MDTSHQTVKTELKHLILKHFLDITQKQTNKIKKQ